MRRHATMPVAALNHAACSHVEGFVRDTLGCAYPLALGAKVAQPDRAVVALLGEEDLDEVGGNRQLL